LRGPWKCVSSRNRSKWRERGRRTRKRRRRCKIESATREGGPGGKKKEQGGERSSGVALYNLGNVEKRGKSNMLGEGKKMVKSLSSLKEGGKSKNQRMG